MTSFISHTSIDCANAFQLSQWWKQVLEYVDKPDDPNGPGDEECWIQRPDGGHPLLFIEVPEPRAAKNRMHLDLRPSAGTRDQEVERLLGLGPARSPTIATSTGPAGAGWSSPTRRATSSASCAARRSSPGSPWIGAASSGKCPDYSSGGVSGGLKATSISWKPLLRWAVA